MNYGYKFFTLSGILAFILVWAPANAKVWNDFTKVKHKEHEIGKNGTLVIENKYGTINITTWDKEIASVEATITVHATNDSEADKVFDIIDVDFITGNEYLKALTEREELGRRGWREWLPWNWEYRRGDNVSYKVDYEVQIPATTKLKLSNRHGDITIPDMEEEASIELRYGDLTAATFQGDVELNLKHGNAVFISAKDLNAEVHYGKLKLKKARDISLNSRYSKISIETGDELDTESRYDKYSLGSIRKFNCEGRYDDYTFQEANDVSINARYSDFRFEKLTEEIKAEMSYGALQISHLEIGFEKVSLEGSHTDFDIKTGINTNFDLDLESEHTHVKTDGSRIKETDCKKNGYITTINTSVGAGSNSRIKANTNYGSFSIQ